MFVLDFQRSGSRVRAVAPARLLVSRSLNVLTSRDMLSSLYMMKVSDMLRLSCVACIQTCGIHRHCFHVYNVVARPTPPGVFVKSSAACVNK